MNFTLTKQYAPLKLQHRLVGITPKTAVLYAIVH